MPDKIIYKLSDVGRKESRKSGGNGEEIQWISVDTKSEHFVKFIELAEIDSKGNATLEVFPPSFYGALGVKKNCVLGMFETFDEDIREKASYETYFIDESGVTHFDKPMKLSDLIRIAKDNAEDRKIKEQMLIAKQLEEFPRKEAAKRFAEEWLEQRSENKRKRHADFRAKQEREKREKEEEKRVFLKEAEEWAQKRGSTRLMTISKEGFLPNSLAVYRDERLSIERSGWIWLDAWKKEVNQGSAITGYIELEEKLNPTLEELEWYRDNKIFDAELKWAHGVMSWDHRCATYDQPIGETVLLATFLGRDIVLRKNEIDTNKCKDCESDEEGYTHEVWAIDIKSEIVAKSIIGQIIDDLRERSGFRQVLDEMDTDTLTEMQEGWIKILFEA